MKPAAAAALSPTWLRRKRRKRKRLSSKARPQPTEELNCANSFCWAATLPPSVLPEPRHSGSLGLLNRTEKFCCCASVDGMLVLLLNSRIHRYLSHRRRSKRARLHPPPAKTRQVR